MSELGALLELLHDAGHSWRTVSLELHEWSHVERSRLALERHNAASGGRSSQVFAFGPGPPEQPEVYESHIRFWLDGVERIREERRTRTGDPYEAVRVGRRWWTSSPGWGVQTSDDEPELDMAIGLDALRMLDPWPLLAGLVLEPAGETDVAGRSALRVLATPRRTLEQFGPSPALGSGATVYELAVDREHGTLLRSTALYDDEPFRTLEVTSIAFDTELPDELFPLEAPPGERVTNARTQYLRLEEAAAAAPFTVVAPRRVPKGWRMHVLLVEGDARGYVPTSVLLQLHTENAAHQLTIQQSAASDRDSHAWVQLVPREGLLVSEGDRAAGLPAWVRVQLEGTRVDVYSSDLDLDALVELTGQLERAPTEPPALG
jgi:hypothetical protein